MERALKLVEEFGKIAGLCLNVKKTKAIRLGKWANNTSNPLGMKWMRSPVKILGVHFSYDEKRNNELNFNQKLKVLQTKLDMWSGQDLTLFGKVMIIKTLGLSQLIYSASNLAFVVPAGIEDTVKTKCFKGPLQYLLRPLLGKNEFAVTQHMYAFIGPNLDNIHWGQMWFSLWHHRTTPMSRDQKQKNASLLKDFPFRP